MGTPTVIKERFKNAYVLGTHTLFRTMKLFHWPATPPGETGHIFGHKAKVIFKGSKNVISPKSKFCHISVSF